MSDHPGSPFWYVSISMQTEGLNGPPTYAMSPPLFPTVKGPVPAWCKTKHIPSAPAGFAPKFTSKENAKICSRSKAHSFHAALVSLPHFSVMFTQSGLPQHRSAKHLHKDPLRVCDVAPHTPIKPKRVIAWAKTRVDEINGRNMVEKVRNKRKTRLFDTQCPHKVCLKPQRF